MDDDSCISPTDASQFLYNRNQVQGNLGNFLIKEEETDDVECDHPEENRRNSESLIMPPNIDIDDESRVKLLSCLDEVRNIVGETATDQHIVDTVLKYNYDMPAILDYILTSTAEAATGGTSKRATLVQTVLPITKTTTTQKGK